MRAADHQFQQPLVVGVMDRQGTPGVKFDVEGSGYGFRVVQDHRRRRRPRCPPAARWQRCLILTDPRCAKPSRTSKHPRSAKSPTPAWAAATCWPSGSARATRSRRSSSAQAAIESLQHGETFYAHNLGLPELREARGALHQRAARPGRRRPHRRHLVRRQRADAGGAGAGRMPATRWSRSRRSGPTSRRSRRSWARKRAARAAASREAGAWTLDLRRAAATPSRRRRKLLLVNAPNNPTGWTLTPRRAAGDAGALPPHRHLDPGRRGLRAAVLRGHAERLRAQLPGHRRRRTTGWSWCTASPRAS